MKINAELRTEVGTSSANRYRRENKIPAVVYNKGSETTPVLLDSKDFDKVLKELGKNGIFDILTAEGKSKQVIIKDFQTAALKYQVLDVELQAITKDQKLTVTVPIILSGAEGVKEGLVSQTLNELEIETTPANIPTEFTADVSTLTIGDSLTVADLSVDKAITVFNEQDETVAIVAPPTVMEEPAEPAEASDPEVIGEDEA